jgi:hypothetical protein
MDAMESMLLGAIEKLADCECDNNCVNCYARMPKGIFPTTFVCIRNEARDILKGRRTE